MADERHAEASVKTPFEPKRAMFRPRVVGWTLVILLTPLAVFLFSRPMTPTPFGRRLYMQSYLLFLHKVQLALREKCVLDEDRDGKAEFTTLGHLLAMADELGWRYVSDDVTEFRPGLGEAKVHGWYLMRFYIPEDVSLREEAWCAVAWPVKCDRKTKYTVVAATRFVANRLRSGAIVCAWTDEPRYSGWGKGPTLKDIYVGEPFKSNLRWSK